MQFLVRSGLAQEVDRVPGKNHGPKLRYYTFHPIVLMGLGLEYPEDAEPESIKTDEQTPDSND